MNLRKSFTALVDFGLPACLAEEVLVRAPLALDLEKLKWLDSRLHAETPKGFTMEMILQNPNTAALQPHEIIGRAKSLSLAGVPWEDIPGFLIDK